ncbi:MAG TPA: MFS transporter [Gammaproteobacteria bacterium]|nr:MFS transporter [Gammaproteobacteria bacterium]
MTDNSQKSSHRFIDKVRSLGNPRILVTMLLAFSSGLPLSLTGSTLQAWYTVSGVSIMAIGALSLVGQPYVYKFLWSPLLDRYNPPFLGRRRGWVAIFQFVLVLSLAIMAFMNPKTTPWLLAFMALLTAFFSATQDIAIDAYRTDLLHANERGFGAAVTAFGYRIALIFSGGLALVMADLMGWRATYLIMAGLLALEMLVVRFSPEPEQRTSAPTSLVKALVEPFKEFLTRPAAIAILLFVLLYKLSDVIALSLSTPFLLRGIGFSLSDVGVLYKTVGLIATLFGAFVGGAWLGSMGLFRSLMVFGILQGLSNLMFAILAIVGKSYPLLIGTIFIEGFCGGLSNVAIIAFLMGLCNVRYTATQYALLSALSAIPRVFIGPFAAWLVEDVGWINFFLISVVAMVPSLILLWWMKRKIDFNATHLG